MNTVTDFLAKLARRGVRLTLDGDRLRVRAARDALDTTDTETLRAHKGEIIALLRAQPAPSMAAATASPRPSELPLSFAQERLWFLAQLDRSATAYNLALLLQLRGPVDPAALADALAVLVARHEVLRTTFEADGGVPRQCIANTLAVPIKPIELSGQPAANRLDAAKAALREYAVRPYDLTHGPLLRVALAKLGDDHHLLLLGMHHIVADGWSLGILTRELDTLYSARVAGRAPILPKLALQYADYALWQRRLASGADWQRQLDWWREQLADVPTLLDLPTERPRPSVQGTEGACLPIQLGLDTTTGLEQLGRQYGATLFQTLLAILAILLRRYSDQEDLVIGTPIANRHHPGIEPVVGCFVNTLPLRVDLSGDPPFGELLERLRHTTLDAYAHQEIPFEQLVNALKVERSLSHAPLFQVMLTVEYAESHPAARDYALGEARGGWIDIERDSTDLDLAVELVRTREGLTGWIDYSRELFESASIERLAGHLGVLAEGVLKDPNRPISTLPLLTEAERRVLLDEWNPSDPHRGAEDCIHTLVEHQAAHTPDATALIVARLGVAPEHSERLTYAELNARANRLARQLLELTPASPPGETATGTLAGGRPTPLIGICVGRSPDLLVVILGILKAGFGYVPIEPSWPQQRIGLILADARPFAMFTEPGLLDTELIKEMIPLDLEQVLLASRDKVGTDLPRQAHPDDIAYVMYTSGSTGVPKGVIIEHRNLVSYVRAFISWARLSAADRALLHGTIAFDMSIEEIFPALAVGATVVICIDPKGIDAVFADAIRHRTTLVCATPQLVQYFNSRADELSELRLLASGGDVLHPEAVDALLTHGIEVHNSFGPTETTVTAVSHRARPNEERFPIGRPLANTRALVLDARHNLVPIGVPGELCIGGAGVARGYLNRPDLTARQFVTWHNGEGLYRTGDRARWRADGTLEFVGRMDRQVKVRGFRVELGEIEAAITLHSAIDQVAVLPRTDDHGQKRLIAYVVPAAGQSGMALETPQQPLTSAAALPDVLREYLRAHLPGYMIPSAFVLLDRLPLTPTGKIDRKRLPDPAVAPAPASARHPRSVTEQDLLAIWREVLETPEVGIFDDFFELGGHSLLAIRLAARIGDVFNAELPLQALFRYPNVAQLASFLEQAHPERSWSTLVALQSRGERPPLFCVPGDGGNVFYFHPLVRALGADRPCYGLESLGLDGKQPPHATVEAAAAHHIEQIQARWPAGPYHLAGHSFGGLVVFEMAQQLARGGARIGMLAVLDTLPPSMPLPQATESELMTIFEGLFAEEIERSTTLSVEQLNVLDSAQRLDALRQALERLEALPANATTAQVRALFEVFRINNQTEYQPGNVIKRPFELLLAEDAPAEEREQIIEGWSRLGQPRVQIVPGSHTAMTYPPHVSTLAEQLRACLTRAEADS